LFLLDNNRITPKKRPLKKSIIIVEDHSIFREGLKKIINEMDDLYLAGEAENGAVFLELLKNTTPDIVLMDIVMPVMDGIIATELALSVNPSLKILVLSMFGEEDYVYSMIDKGICGFILKTSDVSEFKRAIRRVVIGQQYYSGEVMALLVKRFRKTDVTETISLSDKENEVLKLLCKGMSNLEIAEKLFISERTVENYRNRLLQKTGSSNVLKLVIFAVRNKLAII
jgi:DNA-binding NarL/FixJ family response regulator